jgi:chemotaxis protein methyltransferase CheR
MSHRRNGAAMALADVALPIVETEREFDFTDADFRSLVKLAHEHAGISLAESKRNLVYSRLSRRLRALGLRSFHDYRDYLAANSAELESFINAISTNLTKFFREPHHFEHLRANVAASFAQAAVRGSGARLRIWSAGCSSGEEPYTIAAVLRREIPDVQRYDVRILATDIDTEMIARGARGIYPSAAIGDVPHTYREFFQTVGADRSGTFVMNEALRSLIAFRRLNLMDPWPFGGKFDAIFCRNVMIYFDASTKSALIDRFAQQLHHGGWLYIGHSESLIGSHPQLDLVGRTTYRRIQ